MARHGPMILPPTAPDLWLARRIARLARTPVERGAKVVTWTADEKLLVAVVGLAWLGVRLLDGDRRRRCRADHLALTTGVSAALPHLVKRLVDRERPD